MKNIFRVLSLSKKSLVYVVVLSLAVGGGSTGLLYMLANANKLLSENYYLEMMVFLSVLAIVTVWHRVLLKSITVQSEKILKDVRRDLCKHLSKTSYSKFEKLNRSKILATLTHDATLIGQFWPMFINIVVSVVTIVTSLAYLGFVEPLAFAITVVVISFGVWVYMAVSQKGLGMFDKARSKQDEFYILADDLVNGMKELKINRNKRVELCDSELDEITELYFQGSTQARMIYQDAGLIGNSVFFVLAGMVAFILPGMNFLESGTTSVFLLIILYLIGPLTRITANIPFLTNVDVSASRVLRLRDEIMCGMEAQISEVAAGNHLAAMPCDWKSIRLTGVCYQYKEEHKDDRFLIGPFDLQINKGEMVFIVGGNGSGKSTFGKLFTGLYLPDCGTIDVSGVNVSDNNQDDYRQLFSTVFSDYHLFDRALTLSEDNKRLAPKLLQELGLPEDLVHRAGNSKFSKLSKGQQRRLALVLASVEDRDIYFFDEWAADQDPVFRRKYYTEILPMLREKGKTIVAVTHDDKYFHVADRVISIDTGKVVGDVSGREYLLKFG